jgi:hypothetical protein
MHNYEEVAYEFNKDDPAFDDIQARNHRHLFVRKVYLIVLLQLLFTFGVSLLFSSVQPIKSYALNPYVVTSSSAAFIITMFIFACCGELMRKRPLNFLLLIIFTLLLTNLLATITVFYNTNAIIVATVITMIVVICLSLFAFQTKYDFTGWSPLLSGALLTILAAIAMTIMIKISEDLLCRLWSCSFGHMLFSFFGAFLFSFYIIVNTQFMVGGNHIRYQFDTNDYIFAALNLYLDIINMILCLLTCVKSNNN